MLRRSGVLWIASGCLGLLVGTGCSHHVKTGGAANASRLEDVNSNINVNKLSRIAPGMTLADVIREEGFPTDMRNNVYYYKLRGRVVFEGKGMPTDSTKVVRVEEDATEDGYPP